MTIDRLGYVDPVANYNRAARISRPARPLGKDSIDLSEEAQAKAELLRAMDSVRKAPDIREDRIAEVKKRLEDPDYINDKVKGVVADRIVDMFGF
jgi:negative regulator of flagellin synthesis FlgM